MSKLSLAHLQLFDIVLKRIFSDFENKTYFQPIIKIDNNLLSCNFCKYNPNLRPLKLEIDYDGDIFESNISFNDLIRKFNSITGIEHYRNIAKEPELIFELILNFVKNDNLFNIVSEYAYDITFLNSGVTLPFYQLNKDSTYEIVSILQKEL